MSFLFVNDDGFTVIEVKTTCAVRVKPQTSIPVIMIIFLIVLTQILFVFAVLKVLNPLVHSLTFNTLGIRSTHSPKPQSAPDFIRFTSPFSDDASVKQSFHFSQALRSTRSFSQGIHLFTQFCVRTLSISVPDSYFPGVIFVMPSTVMVSLST